MRPIAEAGSDGGLGQRCALGDRVHRVLDPAPNQESADRQPDLRAEPVGERARCHARGGRNVVEARNRTELLVDIVPGSNNFAAAVQGDSSFVGGTESGATNAESVIQQGGDNNVALSIQTGVDQISLIDQQAPTSGNDASVFQGAFGGGTSDAYILQVGDGDSAEIAQNSSGNDADIGQGGGSGNFALIDQGFVGGAGVGGDNNTAIIAQDGSGNFSAIEQNGLTAGSGNIADVLQAADNNTSFVVQDGSTLTATVNQLTDGNFSSVSQGGTGNTATVNQ